MKNYVFNLYAILIVLFIILFPIYIEKIIRSKSVLGVSFNTGFSPNDWFSFWSSYIGAVGTITLGYIALRQNKALSKANDDLNNIQKEYFDNITLPSIRIGNTVIFEYLKTDNYEKYLKDSIDSQYPVVYKLFQETFKNEPCWHTNMSIQLLSISDIPLVDFNVEEFYWIIEDTEYQFVQLKTETYCKLPFAQDFNMCCLNIIYPDLSNKNPILSECGRHIQFHVELSMAHKLVSNFSRIKMRLKVRNQLNKIRIFQLEIDLEKVDQFIFKVKKYFIKPLDIS